MLLGQAGVPSTIQSLSSWVPDWSHNKHAHRGGAMEEIFMGASNGAPVSIRFANAGRSLVLQGLICDSVSDRAALSLISVDDRYGPGTLRMTV
jgi:hypothetical protein